MGTAEACGTSFALLNCRTFHLILPLLFLKGKVFSLDENQSLGSIDSEYDMGSIQRDLNFLEDTPSLKEMVLANQPAPRMTPPFIGLRPANPAMQALTSQKREAHNRSPVSFREGRRASDTSLTQGNYSPCSVTSPAQTWGCACLVISRPKLGLRLGWADGLSVASPPVLFCFTSIQEL